MPYIAKDLTNTGMNTPHLPTPPHTNAAITIHLCGILSFLLPCLHHFKILGGYSRVELGPSLL